jgi:hypothetical protein
MSRLKMNSLPPKFKIVVKEHFWVKGLKESFELSGVIPIYAYVQKNWDNIVAGEDNELNIGTSTIVFSLNSRKDTIFLITGWIGNRKKKEYLAIAS